jgi:RNA polymerase sigma-70 factor (ECF subfamily)
MSDDERKFLEATLPHLDAVHAVARRLCADRSQAEDLVQETYLRAFAGFAGHRGESTRAWLTAICVNAARAEWRRKGRRVAELPLDDDAGGGALDPRMEAHVERESVVRALAQLPEEQRLAIVLMDLAGNTASEVAAIVGAPRGTILARAHRGKRKLAAILRSEGVGRELP